jgi:hypothetical protein
MSAVTYGREKAIRFGTSASLVGVLTEAAPGTASAGRPAVLFLNSGILHRVGSCRLHVRLARALSAAGFHTLRFDYSGIGDSDQRRDSLPFEESAVLETREAMDYLQKAKGVQQFILMGLCSGADMAHDTAIADPRVTGLLLLDGWAYKNLSFHLHHYGPKLLDWAQWRHSIALRWRMLRGAHRDRHSAMPGGEGVEYEVPKYVRVFPPQSRIEADLRALMARDVRLYCIWTGGLAEYNHVGQYAETFRGVPFRGRLREEHLRDADHILTGLAHQSYLVDNAVAWATQYWSGVATPATTTPQTTAAPKLAATA